MAEPPLNPMIAVLAGGLYAACVFGVAFMSGMLRTSLLGMFEEIAPVWAVLVELPVILLASWLICGWVIRSRKVPSAIGARTLMGAVALTLIILAEGVLTGLVTGRGLGGVLASYQRPEVLLGLAGQIAFAAFPLVRKRD